MNKLLSFLLALLFISPAVCAAAPAAEFMLRCEYMETPLGIDVEAPRLMWKSYIDKDNYRQRSFRVRVASTPELLMIGHGDVWDSGTVKSPEQMIYYAGPALESHTRYYWNVEVTGTGGSIMSTPTWFETAKMSPGDWTARWITDGHDINYDPSPMFRKDFTARNDISEARCYISGLGYYELLINGVPISLNLLDPGFTDYGKRVLYVTHDITDYVRGGANTVGVQLGNGWFNEQTPTVWNFHRAPWRSRPQLLCEIHVTYADGSKEVIASGESWKTSTGPIRFDNIHVGTTYDARYEQEGWSSPAFDDSKWVESVSADAPAPILEAQKMPPISFSELLPAVSVTKMHETNYVFDMGKNFAGIPMLMIKGPRGASVTLRHGEMLDSAGNVDRRNINMHLRPRNAREEIQTDIYVLRGGDTELFTPSFTYHGFRYVQMALSEPMTVDRNTLTGVVMHSDVAPIGYFNCSDPLINKIHEICKTSYLSNLFGIPTDCPTREKNGWMADGFMVQEAGMFNYDSRNVYAKWVKDMIDAQSEDGNVPGIVPTSWRWNSEWAGPIWDAAIFIVPSLLYDYTGDVESMRAIYPTAVRYLEYMKTQETEKGLINQGLGDWLYYKAITPVDFMGTCYYYWDNVLMARMAELTGRPGEAAPYREKAERLRQLINENFFDDQNVSYANGTQLSYALPLYMGIAPEQYREQLAANLNEVMKANDYFLDFGFIGSLIVPDILSQYGYADAAFRMATKTTMPSWGDWIENHNATSLFETWDVGRNIGDASRNHPSMGAIDAWMYKTLAGINRDPSAPAFQKIIINPQFVEGLDWVNASYDSQQGLIESQWMREGENVILKVTIPAGATATVVMPDRTYGKLGSGQHTFTARLE